jgi:DNA-directed RNA polymerase subunit L
MMEVKVLEQDEKKLVLEVAGETITLTNLLREELWNDSGISEAAHIKEHPYLSEPKIFVKSSRGNPVLALKKASKRLVGHVEEFREEFKKSLKK